MPEFETLDPSLEEALGRFNRMVQGIRPELHKYCSRMTGSVLDGEDLVQEVLAHAYYKLSMMKQNVPLRLWLFKIAHNKCIDFLRSRRGYALVPLDEHAEDLTIPEDEVEKQELVGYALSTLVHALPPKERACVILKDVLDRSLAEISEILDTSTMAVKAALHRGRQKLRTAEAVSNSTQPSVGKPELLRLYVDLFNKRDWEGVKTLIKADARCEVVGLWAGVGRDAIEGTYLRKYASLDVRWRMSLARVDGEEVVICLGDDAGHWVPRSIVRIEWAGDLVKSIRDYIYIPYLFDDARIVTWG